MPGDVTCASCGQPNPEGARFCNACAAALTAVAPAAREERKVVTALFCDLVGSTAQAERLDPEDVRAILSRYHERVRAELERFGGTVEKFIGDAVMALFGAPVAHEDDPERAVRAALAIRAWATEADGPQVRIGITTGEALVALDARPATGEGMASGDVINTAARLQAAAPVNGIVVDEATYRASERAIEYRPHPPVEAKGKAEPVSVWEPVAARARLGLDVGERATTPLVGRQLEVDLLTAALARARGERSPQLVTLVGVPGIGKSRLVLELLRRVDDDAELIRWRQGRCLPYGEGVTLWALGEIVKAQVGVLESDPAEAAGEKVRAAVRAAVPDEGESTWVEEHLRPLVGLGADRQLAGEGRDEAFAAWRRFFEGVAELGPLVLVFEDLQWADDALLDFVDHLIDWASGVPLLVVATARPELLARRSGWGGGRVNATTQSLSPLSDEQTAALAHAVVGRVALPAEVQQALVTNAGGNPLYAEEFGRMLAEGSLEAGALPRSVQGIIAARLDTLEPADKAILQDAAVLGKVFWISALEALTGEERFGLERRLHELERRELIRRDRQSVVAGERQYAFRHLLVREVAYGQIPRGRRAERHAAAARWIEQLSPDRSEDRADMLAHHWSAALEYERAAGRETDELTAPARAALVEAGDRALRLHAPASAIGFYEQGLALGRTADVLLRFARSLYLVGDERATQALADARDALAAASDRQGEAFAEAMLGHVAWLAGDVALAQERTARALELVIPLPPSETKAHVLARAASRAQVAGRAGEAIELGRQALAIAEELDLVDLRIHALATIGSAKAEQGADDGVEDLERALVLAVAANSPEAGRAAINLGVWAFLQGDVARYRELHAEGWRHAARLDDAPTVRFARGGYPAIAVIVGEWDEAMEAADAFVRECEVTPHYHEAFVRAHRAMMRLARDDVPGAMDDLERVLALLPGAIDPQRRAPPLSVAARLLVELGDPRATEVASDALGIRFGALPEPYGLNMLALADPAADLKAHLRDVVDEAAGESSLWIRTARLVLDERFAEAAEPYARMPFRQAEAEARVRTARQLIAQGRRLEGDAEVQLAMAFWRSVRATRYLRQAESLLAETA